MTESERTPPGVTAPVTAQTRSALPARSIEAKVHSVGCSGLRTISIRGFRFSSGEGDHVAGFDLGPSPEELLLGAIGASLSQTVATVACNRDLDIDRVDLLLEARISVERPAGRFIGIDVSIRLESECDPSAFESFEDDVLEASAVVSLLNVPIAIEIDVLPINENRREAGDWQI